MQRICQTTFIAFSDHAINLFNKMLKKLPELSQQLLAAELAKIDIIFGHKSFLYPMLAFTGLNG